MNSQLLKLDAPYKVIYAGGKVGLHVATLITWQGEGDDPLYEPVSYPVIDMGGEYIGGKLIDTDLDDCRVLCPPGGTNLYWVALMIKYDFQQDEPAGADYILERMEELECKIVMPVEKDRDGNEYPKREFNATLDPWRVKGIGDGPEVVYRVRGSHYQGFYFEAEGNAEEIYSSLREQLLTYYSHFGKDIDFINFASSDGYSLTDVCKRLNKLQKDSYLG